MVSFHYGQISPDSSVLNKKNFDHIVALKDYGTNDPCNLQLTCEHCNKSKGAREKVPKYKYQSWW